MVLEELAGFNAAVGAIQKTINILNSLSKNSKNEAIQEAQQQIIEVQRFVMQSTQQTVTLQKEKNELEAKVKELEDVSEKLERCELRSLGGTFSTLVLKEGGDEHLLCPTCGAGRKISYLVKREYQGGYTLKCSLCGREGDVHETSREYLPGYRDRGHIL